MSTQTQGLSEIAHCPISWSQACEQREIQSLFNTHSPQYALLSTSVELTQQACQMLCSLNEFDRRKVTEQIMVLARSPSSPQVQSLRRNRRIRKAKSSYPFSGYHYLIRFDLIEKGILVRDIFFDLALFESADRKMQRNALFHVTREHNAIFSSETLDADIVSKLETAWQVGPPQHSITTRHAAVNGMLNDRRRAGWLMGTHVDVAYRQDNPQAYTLFHNPTDSVIEDLQECVWDLNGPGPNRQYSHNVRHLAAVLHQCQQRGQLTEWVAHSQGAIIFASAIYYALKRYGGSLSCHRIALHGIGTNLGQLKQACTQAKIEIVAVRNNPYDIVPNVAGKNDLSCSGLLRSLRFFPRMLWGSELSSPHTLPYLGLETYKLQLELSGNHLAARVVGRRLQRLKANEPA